MTRCHGVGVVLIETDACKWEVTLESSPFGIFLQKLPHQSEFLTAARLVYLHNLT